MSRAHMLYDNKPLQSIPVKVTTWDGPWNLEKIFKFESISGVIGEGILLGKSRHLIIDSKQGNLKHHHMSFHIAVNKAYRRNFGRDGEEIQPDFGSKQKVNSGYLMSSYKNVAKEGTDLLSFKQLQDIVSVPELMHLTREKEMGFSEKNVISLWFQEKDFDGMEFGDGLEIRFRTKGNCYLESITCTNLETRNLSNYTSDKPLGGTWTDRVMAMKDSFTIEPNASQDGDGVDDDEWDE